MTRESLLAQVGAGGAWDLVVIGGGATGLGSGLDAASRGYRTLLLEAHDFAKGTSSRSTKLVHGGVRYLAQGRIGLVREALHERGVLLRNAPHLVHARPFLVPAYSRWTRPYYGIGLKAYDLLAGRRSLGASRSVGRIEALRLIPTLRVDRLRGGVVYRDGQFDDARLAIALYRSMVDAGGVALNDAPVVGLVRRSGRIAGVRFRDGESGIEFEVESRAVLNATGVFADAIRHLDEPEAPALIAPSQGAHLVLDRSFLPGETALMVPKTDDGRVLFAIPWLGRVVVGTTDAPVDHLAIEPRPRAEEIGFLLEHAGRYLSKPPRLEDVRSVFAGLRPLIGAGTAAGRSTASLSREHQVFVSDSGLITIAGGKWTTYRRMAADAIDEVIRVAGLPKRPCVTESLLLRGATDGPVSGPWSEYGSDAEGLDRLIAEHPGWAEPIHPDLPIRPAEVAWAARYEAARTIEDILSRRTRCLLLDARACLAIAPRVAELLGEALGRDAAWRDTQVKDFGAIAARYLLNGPET